ncbi:MAG: prephenate dehydratase [Bacteroidales bacterium]
MTLQQENTKKHKVAIQGFAGAFHDMAARKFFDDQPIEILPCHTFKESFDMVKSKKADMAIVAIENSLGGSLLPNYSLLKSSSLWVAGEIYLRIEQNIMALPGQSLSEIKEIHSHPMAIIQCEEYLEPFRKRNIKIVDSTDTALSAKWIAENQLKGYAALASELAAKMYQLEILEKGIETNKRNFTRFLALTQHDRKKEMVPYEPDSKPDKSSICFSLPHKTGSLSQILSVLAFYNINLTKIQSAPIIGKEWEYFFYVDLIFDEFERYQKSLEAISPLIDQLQVLGEYQSGNNHTFALNKQE